MKLSEYPFKTTPFKHQLEGMTFIIKNKGKALIYAEPGTGKTKMVIDFAGFMFLSGKGDRLFVTAPLAGIGQWERQIKLHLPDTIPHEVVRLTGSTRQKIQQLDAMEARHARRKSLGVRDKLVFVLLNYGSFHRKELVARLLRCGFDVSVADECHRLANATTKQSEALWRIGQVTKFRLGLTGTPIRVRPTDFFGQVRFVDSLLFSKRDKKTGKIVPMTWTDFKRQYAIQDNPNMPHLITGVRDAEDIYAKVRSLAFVRRKDECLDLPKKIYTTIPVPLTGENLDAYISMSEEMIAEIEQNAQLISDLRSGAKTDLTKDFTPQQRQQKLWIIARSIIDQMIRLRQIASGIGATKDEFGNKQPIRYLGTDKLDAIEDLCSEIISNNRQVVLFTPFRPELARLEALFKKHKWSYGLIHGNITGPQRDIYQEQFQRGELQGMLCQTAAGSEAIDLFAASYMIFCSLDWSFINTTQAEGRIHRPGQTEPCNYYYVIAESTIEEDILQKLAEKQEYAETFMDTPEHVAGALRKNLERLKARENEKNGID